MRRRRMQPTWVRCRAEERGNCPIPNRLSASCCRVYPPRREGRRKSIIANERFLKRQRDGSSRLPRRCSQQAAGSRDAPIAQPGATPTRNAWSVPASRLNVAKASRMNNLFVPQSGCHSSQGIQRPARRAKTQEQRSRSTANCGTHTSAGALTGETSRADRKPPVRGT